MTLLLGRNDHNIGLVKAAVTLAKATALSPLSGICCYTVVYQKYWVAQSAVTLAKATVLSPLSEICCYTVVCQKYWVAQSAVTLAKATANFFCVLQT
eukprot:1157812-Pelagomonas_calceolata.AAC.10